MIVLFFGFTFLLAHVLFFAHSWGEVFRIFLDAGPSLILVRYVAAAFVAAAFIYFTELPKRLPQKIPGRGFVLVGVVLYTLYTFSMYFGIAMYRPGMGFLMYPLFYTTPFSMVLILIGSGRALLAASPDSPRNV